MAKVIAVYNKKGGCGKTTTATTLAYLLARCGKRTALIDLDSQGDSSLAYGVPNPDKLQTTILSLVKQVIIGEPLPSPSSYMYSYHGVDLVPSNEEISTLERNLSNVDFREYILKEYISQISPSYDYIIIDCTTVKDGKTLSLSNISWAVTGTGLADDTLVPTSYTATATYQATGSRSAATGYITTATYTGEITSEGIGSVQYTVTYLGTQLKSGFSIGLPLLVLLAAGLAMLAAILAFLYLRRPNAAIYAMNAKGVAYKKLGRQRIAVRNPKLDFTKLKEYPAGDSSVELKNKLARKLAGRLISIRLYDGVRTHLVEPIDGNETENYWFAVKDEDKEGSEL